MSPEVIKALTDLAHELAPWASVVVAAIGAWQAMRAKQESKAASAAASDAKSVAAINQVKAEAVAAKVDDVKEKLDAVHETVNGRVEQLREAARKEGYSQAKSELQNNTQGGP